MYCDVRDKTVARMRTIALSPKKLYTHSPQERPEQARIEPTETGSNTLPNPARWGVSGGVGREDGQE